MTKRYANIDDLESTSEAKIPRNSTKTIHSKIDERSLCVNKNTIRRMTLLFDEKEFCVINGDEELSKHDAETLLYQHGAKLVIANPMTRCYCVLVGDSNKVRIKTWILHSNVRVNKSNHVCSGK